MLFSLKELTVYGEALMLVHPNGCSTRDDALARKATSTHWTLTDQTTPGRGLHDYLPGGAGDDLMFVAEATKREIR